MTQVEIERNGALLTPTIANPLDGFMDAVTEE